jgi:hypothetical protein
MPRARNPTRWYMFEEKREEVMVIEAAVSPLMPSPSASFAIERKTLPSNLAGVTQSEGYGLQSLTVAGPNVG